MALQHAILTCNTPYLLALWMVLLKVPTDSTKVNCMYKQYMKSLHQCRVYFFLWARAREGTDPGNSAKLTCHLSGGTHLTEHLQKVGC